MKMNRKYFQYFVNLIIVIGFSFLFNCSKVELPKNSKIISYIIWDKEKPDLFDLTLDYSYQENISLSHLTLYKAERDEAYHLEAFLNEFSECSFGLIPRSRENFLIKDAPLVVMLVEDAVDHSRHILLIGLDNLVSKTVFIRKTKLFFKDINYIEYENEGCYQDKDGYKKYIQLIQGSKAQRQNVLLFDVFKEYRSRENINSGKLADFHLRFLFMGVAFFGGIGSGLILLMLPNRTRSFSRKKKITIAILYGMFCLIISALLLFPIPSL
nr:hypothetical protein [Leptospira santarosai]